MKPEQYDQCDRTFSDKTDMFLMTAHDVSTSLTAISWSLEVLLNGDRGPLTEDQQALLSQIKKQNKEAMLLLHETITAIKKEDFSSTYSQQIVSLEQLLIESISAFTIEASNKGIHFLYHPDITLSTIRGNAQKILIVFHTLIKNAIRYGDSNTDIIISIEHQGDTVCIGVTNKGIGIPEKQQAHIFERFFRGSNTTTADQGFGLGLYGAKKIMEEHRGSLSFKSVEGGETSFFICFPLVIE